MCLRRPVAKAERGCPRLPLAVSELSMAERGRAWWVRTCLGETHTVMTRVTTLTHTAIHTAIVLMAWLEHWVSPV